MGGISLPLFPFEFSVEAASNRMIDARSNKGFKAFNFYLFNVEKFLILCKISNIVKNFVILQFFLPHHHNIIRVQTNI